MGHNIILTKLRYLGLKWSTISWIRSYLSNRDKVTKISGVFLQRREIQCGVHQDSIFGPLLFPIYINDLADHITEGNTYLFVDETAVVISADDNTEMEHKLN